MQPIYKLIYVLTTFMTVAVYFYFYGTFMVLIWYFLGTFMDISHTVQIIIHL